LRKVVPRLNKHDDVIQWNFMKIAPPEMKSWLRPWPQGSVYQNNPQTIGELKVAITVETRQVPKDACVRVIDNFARLVQVCLQRRGVHLEHILDKTWHLLQSAQDNWNFEEWLCKYWSLSPTSFLKFYGRW